MALQLFQLQIPIPTSSAQFLHHTRHRHSHLLLDGSLISHNLTANISLRRRRDGALLAGSEDTELRVTPPLFEDRDEGEEDEKEEEDDLPPSPEDLEYVREIQRVVELLKKNRDMLFSEIKLTIMIEDPREVERRRLLGIEDLDAPTRDELAEALEEVVKEGKVPKNRAALRLLAEEMINWPNLEVTVEQQINHFMANSQVILEDDKALGLLNFWQQVQAEVKKPKRGKSMYAKATDTGIAPEVAAKRLNIDWDSAAEIEDTNDSEENEVPAALGYGALYLVSAFPVIIGISVVLILFYNSLQ